MKATLGLLGLLAAGPAAAEEAKQPWIGEAAPAFKLKTLEGGTVSLEDQKGKIVVLHIAATWCPFCNAEAPNLEALHQKYKDKGVVVLIIDVKEGKRKVAKWAKKKGLSFPVLLDEDGKTARSYAPPGFQPDLERDEAVIASNLLIDREGRIRFFSLLDSPHFDAKLTDLTQRLDELLAEK